MSAPLESLNVLGTRIAAVNPALAIEAVREWLTHPRPGRYICVTGVHGVMEGLYAPPIRRALNRASACVPDGMPLTWVGRLRGHRHMDRVYGPDFMLQVLAAGLEPGWRHYLYGGKPGVADELADAMRQRFPGLQVAGTWCPPFRPLQPAERAEVLAAIEQTRPDIVWIGLSTPKQDLLMADWSRDLKVPLMIGVGAAFDFHTGRLRQAPRCLQRAGLEWLFRLCMEPKRLWRRYFTNNPRFLYHLALQLSGRRQYPLDDGESDPSEDRDGAKGNQT